MSDECPTCGAGRNEETDALYAELATLREKLAVAGAEKDAVLAGEAMWIRKAAEYNDKMRAERAARVQAEAERDYWRKQAGTQMCGDNCAHCLYQVYQAERGARVRAEAALSRARELLGVPFQVGNNCLCWLIDATARESGKKCWTCMRDAFLADPANTPKEPTADGK